MDATTPFTPQAWESFYVIVGCSAGALTGLQFVVLTLITEAGMIRGSGETLSAFGSPNVVHFCAALPLVAYAALVHAGIQLARVSTDALFIVGGSALLLVFIGIHNAWDTVTYVTLERARERKAKAAGRTQGR